MKGTGTLVVAGLLSACALPARAALIVDAAEAGNDVVFTGSGTLDLTGLSPLSSSSLKGLVDPQGPTMLLGAAPASNVPVTEYYSSGIVGPVGFGPGPSSIGDAGTGDRFGMEEIVGLGPAVVVPNGYVSDSLLTSSITFTNESLATLGLTQGSYVWSWGTGGNADTFTLNIIPEPTTLSMVGIGGLMMLGRRRR